MSGKRHWSGRSRERAAPDLRHLAAEGEASRRPRSGADAERTSAAGRAALRRSSNRRGKGLPELFPIRLMSPPCCGGGTRSCSAKVPGPGASMPAGSRCVRWLLPCRASRARRSGGAEARRTSKWSGGAFARRTAAAPRAAMASWQARVPQASPAVLEPAAHPPATRLSPWRSPDPGRSASGAPAASLAGFAQPGGVRRLGIADIAGGDLDGPDLHVRRGGLRPSGPQILHRRICC